MSEQVTEGPKASNVAATATALTGEAQRAANVAIDSIQALGNHIFDAGEGGLGDALKVVDELQTQVSTLLSTITGQIAGRLQSKG